MLAGKVLCVARLHGDPRLYAGWKVLCVARLYVAWLGRFFV